MAFNNMDRQWQPARPNRRSLILCFDGTGNKFQGNSGDSNIIKIYSMLERQVGHHYTYYQPGIGTYIEDSALSKSGRLAKLRSWYMKAKDQAVGTSFDRHVEGGYKFLMQHYSQDDDIYLFGFSRGAYICRFLAQMLDSVGLLNAGNEEMFRFAWKAFAQWQTRLEETDEQKAKKKEMYHFMKAFRETFSRPVRRIRFMGLFDTVNSVPQFENRWMQRSKFPYSAKTSARVVRHAVAIDERRAKFRQHLCSQKSEPHADHHVMPHMPHPHVHEHHSDNPTQNGNHPQRKPPPLPHNPSYHRYVPRKPSLAVPMPATISERGSQASLNSATAAKDRPDSQANHDDEDDEDDDKIQDVEEVWFPGCHADIGGGWPVEKGEDVSLSHAPLMWMIREARSKGGLPFDEEALREANYIQPDINVTRDASVPHLQVDGMPAPQSPPGWQQGFSFGGQEFESFRARLVSAGTQGRIHDALAFNKGTPPGGVISWRIMEYMPFRRMDLKEDGTWAPIRFPLPMGEVRDLPHEAWIHNSAIRRMQSDEKYRPGNLIIGGGGRGVRTAPAEFGIGKWKVLREEGDPVGEVMVRSMDEMKEKV